MITSTMTTVQKDNIKTNDKDTKSDDVVVVDGFPAYLAELKAEESFQYQIRA